MTLHVTVILFFSRESSESSRNSNHTLSYGSFVHERHGSHSEHGKGKGNQPPLEGLSIGVELRQEVVESAREIAQNALRDSLFALHRTDLDSGGIQRIVPAVK